MSIKGLFADFRDYITMKPEPEVRDFVAGFDWKLNQRTIAANTVAGSRHLQGIDTHSAGAEQRLVQSLMANVPELHWGRSWSPEDFGQEFFDNYGWVEMFGTRGHFDGSTMSGGFFLQGPNLHYPSHFHVAEELYIPLTGGSYWMRDGGAFVERSIGEVFVHESNETHAIETPDTPLLALYMWRGGDLAQKPDL